MIEVSHLTKYYGSFCALEDVSFSIETGEVVGLLGPNGAGKSTAMNILTGCLAPTEGRVLVDGVDVEEEPLVAKSRVGFLPEQPPLYPDMTVGEYLRFVFDLKKCLFPREPHLGEICELVGLGQVRGRLIGQLSKGYRQRVGIAQALVGDPGLVILDEPTVGLDPKQMIEVRNLIRTLAKRHTVLLSTHILAEVQAVCHRVIILKNGRIAADKPIEALAAEARDKSAWVYAVCGPQKEVTAALRALPDVRDVTPTGTQDGDAVRYTVLFRPGTDGRRAVARACARGEWLILSAAPAGDGVESAYLKLTDK